MRCPLIQYPVGYVNTITVIFVTVNPLDRFVCDDHHSNSADRIVILRYIDKEDSCYGQQH